MANYIDKDALVAEIKARISDIEVSQKAGLIKKRDAYMKITLFKSILSLLDTLEVKEVDLNEEDMKLVWNLGDEIPYMSEEEFFKELLRRYKAQKGE